MKDLRDYIALTEKEGELKRITAEVDWNLELSHIAKLNEEAQGPALLFENVKDYDTPVLTSSCTTAQKLALILGLPKETPLPEILRSWVKMGRNPIPAEYVDKKDAPCKQNILMGDDVDLLQVPGPPFLSPGWRQVYRNSPFHHHERS